MNAKYAQLIEIELVQLDLEDEDVKKASVQMSSGSQEKPSIEKIGELLTLAVDQLLKNLVKMENVESGHIELTLSECPKCREIRYNGAAGKCEACGFTD